MKNPLADPQSSSSTYFFRMFRELHCYTIQLVRVTPHGLLGFSSSNENMEIYNVSFSKKKWDLMIYFDFTNKTWKLT
jgi:hypothetical protein